MTMDPSDGIDWKGWYILLNYCSFFIFIIFFQNHMLKLSKQSVNNKNTLGSLICHDIMIYSPDSSVCMRGSSFMNLSFLWT